MLLQNTRWFRSAACAAVVAALCCTNAAFGVMWTNYAGDNARFGWNSGQNDVGLFQDPTISEVGFSFDNINRSLFRAEVGFQNSAGDMTQVRVVPEDASVPNADPVSSIVIREHGTWWAEDLGDLQASASFNIFRWDNFQISPTIIIPIIYNPDRTWTAEYLFTTGPDSPGGPGFLTEMTDFRISVSNSLNVLGSAPGGTYMDKYELEVLVPEPTAAFLLLGISTVLLRRRRLA